MKMTGDEAIQVGRTLAEKKGWPWVEPLFVEATRRFILFGRRYWQMTTNSEYADIGRNVHIQIDDRTGLILTSEYVPNQTFHS